MPQALAEAFRFQIFHQAVPHTIATHSENSAAVKRPTADDDPIRG